MNTDMLAKPADYTRQIGALLDRAKALTAELHFRNTLDDLLLLDFLRDLETDGLLVRPADEIFTSLTLTPVRFAFDPYDTEQGVYQYLIDNNLAKEA